VTVGSLEDGATTAGTADLINGTHTLSASGQCGVTKTIVDTQDPANAEIRLELSTWSRRQWRFHMFQTAGIWSGASSAITSDPLLTPTGDPDGSGFRRLLCSATYGGVINTYWHRSLNGMLNENSMTLTVNV